MNIKLSGFNRTETRSQHQFQLDAIADSLDLIVRMFQKQTGAEKSGGNLNIRISQHSVSLCVQTDNTNSGTTELEFMIDIVSVKV